MTCECDTPCKEETVRQTSHQYDTLRSNPAGRKDAVILSLLTTIAVWPLGSVFSHNQLFFSFKSPDCGK